MNYQNVMIHGKVRFIWRLKFEKIGPGLECNYFVNEFIVSFLQLSHSKDDQSSDAW